MYTSGMYYLYNYYILYYFFNKSKVNFLSRNPLKRRYTFNKKWIISEDFIKKYFVTRLYYIFFIRNLAKSYVTQANYVQKVHFTTFHSLLCVDAQNKQCKVKQFEHKLFPAHIFCLLICYDVKRYVCLF